MIKIKSLLLTVLIVLTLFSFVLSHEIKRADASPLKQTENPSTSDVHEGLIGVYKGQDSQIIFLEKDGSYYVLSSGDRYHLLEKTGKDKFVFTDSSPINRKTITFNRDESGFVENCRIGERVFVRQRYGKEEGETFRIIPLNDVETLRAQARRASPPPQPSGLLKPDFVDLETLDSAIKLDIRYASKNNFMGEAFYEEPKAYLQRPAAEALHRVVEALNKQGYGIIIFDAYRPWYVTKMFWDATPDHLKEFVADPSTGSRHNRGCAVDLTLYDLKTGRELEMPSGYDEFSIRAYSDFKGGTTQERQNRETLRKAMEKEGFTVLSNEWWHFDFKDWWNYPVSNQSFEEIGSKLEGLLLPKILFCRSSLQIPPQETLNSSTVEDCILPWDCQGLKSHRQKTARV